jgi:peptidyl-prolyl cis-trans isomerase D
MAVLSKIRNRSGLLLIVIAFALIAFVVGDIIQSGSFGQPSRYVGSINDKDISSDEFVAKVNNLQQSGQGMTSIQAANQVWNQEISLALLTAEFEKLGLRVGEKHIVDVFKQDPNIGQNPMFLNAAGNFDVLKFKEYFKANPEGVQFLKEREKDAELSAKYQIYNSLLKGGLYTTTAEAKLSYEMGAEKATFDYVYVPYTSVKDSDVKVSDDEINAYIKSKGKRFESEETREIDYVLIADKPSVEDENEIKNKVNALLAPSVAYNKETGKNDTIPGFRSINTNIAEFVNANSDIPFDSTYRSKQEFPAEHADKLFALPVGEIYGPYMIGENYMVSKILGRKAGAKAKASHILISWEGTPVPNQKEKRTKEEAKAKADNILSQAQANPANFFMLAMTNSDDSSAQQGGDLGFFGPGQMVKPFENFVFNNPIGKIGLVETEFGYHIITVTDKQDAIKLATISQKIVPSENTNNQIYEQSTKFEMDAASKDFATLAKQMKLEVTSAIKLRPMDESFDKIQNQRQIVKWAFSKDASINDVKRFEVANVGHVIAKLNKINKKGYMSVDEARPMVEPILKTKKKAEMIKAKLTGSSLATMASANKVVVMNAVDLTLTNPSIPAAGYEPKVVGTALATKVGQVSKPIDGNVGVYVVSTKAVTKAPAITDYKQYVDGLNGQIRNYSTRAMNALRTNSTIEDNRADFF